jgi:stage II sporulation protein M
MSIKGRSLGDMSWRNLVQAIKEMKHYLIAAAATFLVGAYLGYSEPGQFQFLLDNQIKQLTDMVNNIGGHEHYQWRLLAFILVNNVLVSVFMVYSGVMLGIIPLYSLLSNGLIMGYLAHQNVPDKGWGSFILAILPHGIIELPAFILACAFGIKFGAIMFKSFFFLFSPTRRAANNAAFIKMLKVSVPLVIIVALLLMAAALIESMVTLRLVS